MQLRPVMGWSGRAPPSQPYAGLRHPDKEHAMSQILNTVAVIGIDIGKNSFHVVGHDKRGTVFLATSADRRLTP